MKFTRLSIVLLMCLALPLAAYAGSRESSGIEEHVIEYRLDNGMRWLLVKRRQAPVFSGVVMVRAGGADEAVGKAGLAHMLEHMAFKGSRVIGTRDWAGEETILKEMADVGRALTAEQLKEQPDREAIAQLTTRMDELKSDHAQYYVRNEVWEILSKNGARELNAYTSKDVTAYHASMPINRLGLWAAVFSEMLSDSVFREFYTERDVVAEERRMGIDNNPDGRMVEVLLEQAFQDSPYGWSTIGSAREIQGYLLEEALAFQERHYVPERMVGVIVGDINIRETKRIVRRYFGRAQRRSPPPEVTTEMGVGGGERVLDLDAEPALAIAYHKPTLPDPTEYVFDVITTLLCDGPTSILHRRLVIEERVARSIGCSDAFPGSRLPNLFVMWAEPLRGTSPERLRDMIEREIDSFKENAPKQQGLERVRTKVAASFVFGLETNMALAQELARFETIFNDWRLLAAYPRHIDAVTAEDVQTIAQRYFVPENQTVVMRVKKGRGDAR